MNPVLDFYITIGIFVLIAIGGMKLSKLDNLMSSWISGKNSSKKRLDVVSETWWVRALYKVGYALIFGVGYSTLVYFVFLWLVPINSSWLKQHVGFHDGQYLPLWPQLLAMLLLGFLAAFACAVIPAVALWSIKRGLLAAGFLEWKTQDKLEHLSAI